MAKSMTNGHGANSSRMSSNYNILWNPGKRGSMNGTELKITNDYNCNNMFKYDRLENIYITITILGWLRLEWRALVRVGGLYIDLDRKRNSRINCSSSEHTANQSSDPEAEELMEHSYVVGRKGTTGLIKLSKVVVHNIYFMIILLYTNSKF